MHTIRSRADGLSLGFFCKLNTEKTKGWSEKPHKTHNNKIYFKIADYIYIVIGGPISKICLNTGGFVQWNYIRYH